MSLKQLPAKGRDKKELLSEIVDFAKDDPSYKTGKTWSLVYHLDNDHTSFLQDAYNMFFSANGLNPTVFKSLKKFETEIIQITAGILNGGKNTVGVLTSGGTESCLLAVKTYRDYARKVKRIKKPEMILPETAHVAWDKGGEYFNVKIRRAPLDGNFLVNTEAVEKLINRNTVMVVGSAPEYPHGLIDPIEKLGGICSSKKIPLHVDACVGGFLLPFIEKSGINLPLWDYRIPGVSSISADIHKYGFAAKGASTITYRSMDIMKHQFFVYENWPGGIFASPALLGTRPGGAYAAAWAALQALGEDGYLRNAGEILKTREVLLNGIGGIPELEIIGSPQASLFSYRSKDKKTDIFAVGDQMELKGWQIDKLHRPEALHAMITPLHRNAAEDYLSDLKESVGIVKADPGLAKKGSAALYGAIAKVPLRGVVKKKVLDVFAGMYETESKEIDAETDFK